MPRRSAFSYARDIHAWCAALIAVVLLVVSLTGSALVWKREYLWLSIPQSRGSDQLSVEQASQVYAVALARFGDDLLLTTFGHEHLALHKLYLKNRRYAYLGTDGELLAQWQAGERFEELLYDFHHRLLLETPGLWIVGFSGLLMIVLVPLGVVAWWPSRRSFSIKLWVNGALRTRRETRMTHRNFGISLFIPLLAVLISGVILVFPKEAQQFFIGGTLSRPTEVTRSDDKGIELNAGTNVEHILKRAQAKIPDSTIRSLSYTEAVTGLTQARYSIALQRRDELHPRGWNTVVVSDSGQLLQQLDSQTLSVTEKAYKLMWPLHSGRIDSVPYKILLTIFGLAMSTLAVLGLKSFSKRWRP